MDVHNYFMASILFCIIFGIYFLLLLVIQLQVEYKIEYEYFILGFFFSIGYLCASLLFWGRERERKKIQINYY